MLLTYDAIRTVRNPCERFWKRLSFFSKPMLPLCLWEEDPESYRAMRDNIQRVNIPPNIPCGTCEERHEMWKKSGYWLEVRAGERKCSERYLKPLRVWQDQKVEMYELDLKAVLTRWAEKWPVRSEVKKMSDLVTWQLGVGRLIDSGDSATVLVCLSHLPVLVGAELNRLNLTPPYIVLHACDAGCEFSGIPEGVLTYPLWTFLTLDLKGLELAESILSVTQEPDDTREELGGTSGEHGELRDAVQKMRDEFALLQDQKHTEVMITLRHIMGQFGNLSIEDATIFHAFWKAGGDQKKAWESLPEDRRKSYPTFNRKLKRSTSKLGTTPKAIKKALAVASSKSISPDQINPDVDVENLSGNSTEIQKDNDWFKDEDNKDRILRDYHRANPEDKKEMENFYYDIKKKYKKSESYSKE